MEPRKLFVELGGLVRALEEAVVAEYIQLELQELETAVEQLELKLEDAGKDAEFIEELVEEIQADQRLGQKEAVDLVRQAQNIMTVIKGERAKVLERVPEMVKRPEVALETWREIEQVVAETR